MWTFHGAANQRALARVSGTAVRPPARGSGASLSVYVSARSNSRIPYLEARGSCYCQESQIIAKWFPAKSFKINILIGERAETLHWRSSWLKRHLVVQINHLDKKKKKSEKEGETETK